MSALLDLGGGPPRLGPAHRNNDWRLAPADPTVLDGLRSYQVEEVLRAHAPAWAWYADPRLGKTRMAVRTMLRWIRECGVRRIFVTGPLEPLRITWMKELHAAGFRRPSAGGGVGYVVPLYEYPIAKTFHPRTHNTPTRTKVLDELAAGAAGDVPVVVLLNDEVLGLPIRREVDPRKRLAVPKLDQSIRAWGPEAVVADEAHRYKNAGADRSRALFRIMQQARFRRLLSGTPDPNGYQDFHHQFKLLDPAVFGTNKALFLRQFAYTRGGPHHSTLVTGWRDVDGLFARVRSRASIIKAADYFDVPPIEEIVRELEMPEKVRKWYRDLARRQVLELEELGVAIDATHVLARLTRCAQFTSGFLPTEDESIAWLHDLKIQAVLADCSEIVASGGKVVVSHQFKPEGRRLVFELQKRFGETTVLALNGDTPHKQREAAVAPFSLDHTVDSPARILVAQESVGGVGLSLARADHLIFASWSFGYDDVEQMRKRVWDAAKKRMTATYIVIPGTVDRFKLTAIRRKGAATIMAQRHSFDALASGEYHES